MDNKLKMCFVWSGIFLFIEFILLYMFEFHINSDVLVFSLVGLLYIVINLFFIKYKRERLFINGLISYITVIMLGSLIGTQLVVKEVVGIGVTICLMDYLSFTRFGKRTPNARAMSNINFMSKLIVYGKGSKDVLYPTCGIGDYIYYSIWISGLGSSTIKFICLSSALAIGTFINDFIVYKIHNRENYKGLPATVVPFLCVMICYYFIR